MSLTACLPTCRIAPKLIAFADDPLSTQASRSSAFHERRERDSQLVAILNRQKVLSVWIAQAPDTVTRQVRNGIAYILCGQPLNPPQDWTLEKAYASAHEWQAVSLKNAARGDSVLPANLGKLEKTP